MLTDSSTSRNQPLNGPFCLVSKVNIKTAILPFILCDFMPPKISTYNFLKIKKKSTLPNGQGTRGVVIHVHDDQGGRGCTFCPSPNQSCSHLHFALSIQLGSYWTLLLKQVFSKYNSLKYNRSLLSLILSEG